MHSLQEACSGVSYVPPRLNARPRQNRVKHFLLLNKSSIFDRTFSNPSLWSLSIRGYIKFVFLSLLPRSLWIQMYTNAKFVAIFETRFFITTPDWFIVIITDFHRSRRNSLIDHHERDGLMVSILWGGEEKIFDGLTFGLQLFPYYCSLLSNTTKTR